VIAAVLDTVVTVVTDTGLSLGAGDVAAVAVAVTKHTPYDD
jgi:hypothetical protein